MDISWKLRRKWQSWYLLLLLRALPLPCQKVYGPVRSSMPVTLLSLTIYNQRTLLWRVWSLELQISFTVFSNRRNNRMCPISSLKGTGNCFCSNRILRQNSYSSEVNLEMAKALLLKIKVSRLRWGQSNRYNLSGTSGIPNLFFASLLVVKLDDPVWQKSHKEKYKRFFFLQVSFSIFEYDFNSPLRNFPL